MPGSFRPDLAALLALGRPGEWPVAFTANGTLTWNGFQQKIAARTTQWQTGSPRRLLMVEADPGEFAATLLAALACGHTPVIPPNFRPDTLADMEARLADDRMPLLNGIELYTSGSSGTPKRIAKCLDQLEAECRALESLWGKDLDGAAIAATVPHHHIYGLLFRLLWPLLAGRPFDIVTCAEPTTLAERLTVLGDCALIASPAQLARLPELVDLNSLAPRPRRVFSSGGPLAATVAAAFHAAWGAAPTEVFGSTETGGIAWRHQENGNESWTPLPSVQIGIGDDCALQVSSLFLPDPTPWRMDDAAELLPDGRFRLAGRLDRTVKIEEKRLALPEMEARLAAHPWVETAAVVPLVGERRILVGALIVPSNAGQAALAADRRGVGITLRRHLAAWYDPVLLPRRWRFTETLPYDERGKLPRAALTALFATP